MINRSLQRLEQRLFLTGLPLVADINTATADATPSMGAAWNGNYVFAATSKDNGREVWITNGTAAGTRMVVDTRTGSVSSDPFGFTALGERLLFWARDSDNLYRPYSVRSDGTELTRLTSFVSLDNTTGFAIVGSQAIFCAGTSGNAHVYRTDGTAAGTLEGASIYTATQLISNGTTALCVAYDTGPSSPSLFSVDENTGGLTQLAHVGSSSAFMLGNVAVFRGVNGQPWITDFTVAGTRQMATLSLGTGEITRAIRIDANQIALCILGYVYVYNASTQVMNGPIDSSIYPTSVEELSALNGKLYFTGRGLNASVERGMLVRWDPTTPAAAAVTIHTRFALSSGYKPTPRRLSVVNGKLMFFSTDTNGNAGLFTSDGTAAGTTIMLSQANGGPGQRYLTDPNQEKPFDVVNNVAYFAGFARAAGEELWRSDGTTAGTYLTRDILTTTLDANDAPSAFLGNDDSWLRSAEFNGKHYFGADDGIHGRELWATDGTATGTELVADLAPGGLASSPGEMVTCNGSLYFTGYSNAVPGARVLYKSDGTAAGTQEVRTSVAGGYTIVRDPLRPSIAVVGNRIAFYGQSASTYAQNGIWFSDGTTAGTNLVGNTFEFPNYQPNSSLALTVVGDKLYFIVENGDTQFIARHDGTGWVGINNSFNPAELTAVGDKLFFRNFAGYTATPRVAVVDAGTAASRSITVNLGNVYEIEAVDGQLYFSGYESSTSRYRLARTDGTTTVVLNDAALAFGEYPKNMRSIGGKLWFSASVPEPWTGREPWVSDGTSGGTFMIADVESGPPASQERPDYFDGRDGYVYFQATTAAFGTELYRSNGQAGNLELVWDTVPGPGSGTPGPFMHAGHRSLLWATDAEVGRELRLLGTDETTAPFVSSFEFRPILDHRIKINFSEHVYSSVDPTDFVVTNIATGAVVNGWTLERTGNSATLRFASRLSDGRYRVSISAGGGISDDAGNTCATQTRDFSYYMGDVDGNGAVDFLDLLTIAQNYGTIDRGYSYGDLNYDRTVNFTDLLLLAQRYGTSLLSLASVPQAPRTRKGGVASWFDGTQETSNIASADRRSI